MFYELYRGSPDTLLDGALWFDPDSLEYIEVIDMGSAAGEEGLWMANLGDSYIDESALKEALESAGLLHRPPPRARGRKEWDPRFAWPPPAAPGLPGDEVLQAFRAWEEKAAKGDGIEDLSPAERSNALYAAELVFGYHGFDGGPNQSVLVAERGSPSVAEAERHDGVVTKNPERYLKALLRRWGVEFK